MADEITYEQKVSLIKDLKQSNVIEAMMNPSEDRPRYELANKILDAVLFDLYRLNDLDR